MDSSIPYNGSLTREKWLFPETQIVCSLVLNDGLSEEEVVKRVYENNLFQHPTNRELKSIARACYRRVNSLDNYHLKNLLLNGTYEQKCQVNMYAMMRSYRVVWEFMIEVIGDHYSIHDYSLTRGDINIFMHDLQLKDDRVNSWSDATVKRIASTLANSLASCGIIESINKGELLPFMLDDEVKEGIILNQDEIVLPSFNCFN